MKVLARGAYPKRAMSATRLRCQSRASNFVCYYQFITRSISNSSMVLKEIFGIPLNPETHSNIYQERHEWTPYIPPHNSLLYCVSKFYQCCSKTLSLLRHNNERTSFKDGPNVYQSIPTLYSSIHAPPVRYKATTRSQRPEALAQESNRQ